MDINRNQRRRVVMRLRKELGGLNDKTIAILGLSFKPNTDDIREAPALEVIHLLQNEGAVVRAYDPQAMEGARQILHKVVLCENPYEAAEGADAIILTTEWNEFKHLDFEQLLRVMKQPVIFDGRNLWDPNLLQSLGFKYHGIGRGNHV
jgi:UDPglucose 6-dehydrogenase